MRDQKQQESSKQKKPMDDNVIFIGTKPFMNYVTAVVMQVTVRNKGEIKVIARGKFISKAVDVVEIARNRFLEKEHKVVVKDVKIGSEKFNKKNDSGEEKEFNVSTIEITIVKE